MEKNNITQKILNAVSSVVGIVGFASLDFSDSKDTENTNCEQGIIVKEHDNQLDVSVAIIILSNVSAKGIMDEIYQVINYILHENKLILGYLNIFIRGIE